MENKDDFLKKENLESNELGEVAGGHDPEHKPMPLYGIKPSDHDKQIMLKYGIPKPIKPGCGCDKNNGCKDDKKNDK